MPTVSIGLPVFNGAEYLEDSIRSVLGQTLNDLELIVSDNASTDRTGEIAQDLAAADSRIRYLRNDRNLGAAPNYNITYHASTDAFFKWLAHDDRSRLCTSAMKERVHAKAHGDLLRRFHE